MQEVYNILHNKKSGFMVHFEWYGDGFFKSDHFPDKHAGEELINTESEAWELAERFAKCLKGKICNLYVMNSDFSAVDNYKQREILNR